MIRRSPDPVALVMGAAFVALGVVAIAGRIDLLAGSQWVWPAVLVAVGIIMLAAVIRPRRYPSVETPPPPPPPAVGQEPPAAG